MKKFRAIVLDKYVDFVIREMGEFGEVQVLSTDTEKLRIDESPRQKIYDISLEILRRIDNLCNILGISKDKIVTPISLGIENRSNDEILGYIDKEIKKIEEETLGRYERLNELKEEKEKLKSDKRILRILKAGNVDPGHIGESEFLYSLIGFLNPNDWEESKKRLEEELGSRIALIRVKELDGNILVVIVCPIKDKKKLDKIISSLPIEKFELNYNLNLSEIEEKLECIKREEEEIISHLNRIREENETRILAMYELAEIEKNSQSIRFMLGKTERVYVLEGWIPEEKIPEFEERANRISKGNIVIRYYEPEESDEIPIVMKNPSISRPFESITKAFGLPAHNEIDPTSIMVVSFPIIYGMMFGDVGHGFIILLLGIAMIKFFSKGSRDIKNLGAILIYCAILSMIFGFAYGEMFGKHEFYHDLITNTLGIRPLWINPLEDANEFLGVAFIVGFIHMSSGILLKFINYIMNREFYHAIAGPLLQEWIFIGGAYLIIKKGLRFTEWFNDPVLLFLSLGLPLIGILFSDVIKHIPQGVKAREIPSLIRATLLELYEIPVGLLANSISYSRIFALALVHIGLFTALFKISEMVAKIEGAGLIIYSIVVIIGTLAIVCMEGFIVFLHTVRLHYYEWFSKFYNATGIEYKPFRIKRVYTYIKR